MKSLGWFSAVLTACLAAAVAVAQVGAPVAGTGGASGTANVTSGTIDGATIGGTTPAAGSFSPLTVGAVGTQTIFVGEAANAVACRNGASGCTVRIYNTFTDASNYERAILSWISNALVIRTEALGTGTSRNLHLGTNGTNRWTVLGSTGDFYATTDNTNDIGAIGANRPKNIWVAGSVNLTAPNTQSGTTYTVLGTDNFIIANGSATLTLTLPTASTNTGRTLRVKTTVAFTVVSATTNVVPLAGGSAAAAILAATAGKWADLTSDGTNWVVMAGN